MAVVVSFRDAWESIPAELRENAREALLVLSRHLYEVDERWSQLGPEARMIWLDAQSTFTHLEPMRRLLARVSSVAEFLENWTDMVASDEMKNDDDYDFVQSTEKKADAALRALFAVVDHVRKQVGQ